MTKLYNEIIINAPIEKIWQILSKADELDKYDPTVKKSLAITEHKTGIGSARKVIMLDGKNWFEETCSVYEPGRALAFELTACSFPVKQLSHRYSFEQTGGQTKVKQVMEYQVKFGLLGKMLDALAIRKQSDTGIKKFFAGLKTYAESA